MRTMEEIDAERLRRLFADTTACLEEAHEIAMESQAAGLPAEDYSQLAEDLGSTINAVAELVSEITRLADGGKDRED